MQALKFTTKTLKSLANGTFLLSKLEGADEDYFPSMVVGVHGSVIKVVRTRQGEESLLLPLKPSLLKPVTAGDISASAAAKLRAKAKRIAGTSPDQLQADDIRQSATSYQSSGAGGGDVRPSHTGDSGLTKTLNIDTARNISTLTLSADRNNASFASEAFVLGTSSIGSRITTCKAVVDLTEAHDSFSPEVSTLVAALPSAEVNVVVESSTTMTDAKAECARKPSPAESCRENEHRDEHVHYGEVSELDDTNRSDPIEGFGGQSSNTQFVFTTPARPRSSSISDDTKEGTADEDAEEVGTESEISELDDMDGLDSQMSSADPLALSLDSDGTVESSRTEADIGFDGDDLPPRTNSLIDETVEELMELDDMNSAASGRLSEEPTVTAMPNIPSADFDHEADGVGAMDVVDDDHHRVRTGTITESETEHGFGESRGHVNYGNIVCMDVELPVPGHSRTGLFVCAASGAGLLPPSNEGSGMDFDVMEAENSSSASDINMTDILQRKCFRALRSVLPVLDAFITADVRNAILSEQIIPSAGEDNEEGQPYDTKSQSRKVLGTLRTYQLEGQAWLLCNYDNGINSILGDGSFFGRRLQIISFLSHLVHARNIYGFHLIVAHVSDIFHWENEFSRWCPDMIVLRMHTNNESYLSQFEQLLVNNSIDSVTGASVDTPNVVLLSFDMLDEKSASFISKIFWKSIVVDCENRLNKADSPLAKSLLALSAHHRVILSSELPSLTGPALSCCQQTYACLRFLHPKIFNDAEPFMAHCIEGDSSLTTRSQNAFRNILAVFMLRRQHSAIDFSALPTPVETVVYCQKSELQRELAYEILKKNRSIVEHLSGMFDGKNNFGTRAEVNINGAEYSDRSSTTAGENRASTIVKKLQKVANHPYMLDDIQAMCLPNGSFTDDILLTSGKMNVLDKLLLKLKECGNRRVLLVSQYPATLDLLEDFLWWRRYPYMRHHDINSLNRRILSDQFNREVSDRFVSLQSSKSTGACRADTIIFYDSSWDALVDCKVVGKCRRLQGSRALNVFRLVTKGSVDEIMLRTAQAKLSIDTVEDMRFSAHQPSRVRADTFLPKKSRKRCLADGVADPGEYSELNYVDSFIHRGVDADQVVPLLSLYEGLKAEWNDIYGDSASRLDTPPDDLISALLNGVSHADAEKFCTTLAASSNLIPDADVGLAPFRALGKVQLQPVVVESSGSPDVMSLGYDLVKKRKLDETGKAAVNVEEKHLVMKGHIPSTTEAIVGGPMLLRVARLKAKRAFSNQDFCLLCWDGGDLWMCDFCPSSYHKKLECVTNITCMTSDNSKSLWKCPHHKCGLCQRDLESVMMLFACEICPAAYCESCLIPGAVIIGPCARYEAHNHRMRQGMVYIHCTKECNYFAHNEAERNIKEIEEINNLKNKSRNESCKSSFSVTTQNTGKTTISHRSSDVNFSAEHPDSLLAKINAGKAQYDATATAPLKKGNTKLEFLAVNEIMTRLGRGLDPSPAKVRFNCVQEISGFAGRWNVIPFELQTKIACLVEVIIGCFNRIGTGKNETNSLETTRGFNEDDAIGIRVTGNDVLAYCGIPSGIIALASKDNFIEVYLAAVAEMASWSTQELADACVVLGIGGVVPAGDVKARRGPLPEPKFRWITPELGFTDNFFFKDAIFVLLITMSPQNMLYDLSLVVAEALLSSSQHTAGNLNLLTHLYCKSPFYVLRWLDALSKSVKIDDDFFVSAPTYQLMQRDFVPGMSPITIESISAMAPGFRLYAALGQATYLEEYLKLVYLSYVVIFKYLKIQITEGAVVCSGPDPISISWAGLRRISETLILYFSSRWMLSVGHFIAAERRFYNDCMNGGAATPEVYCRSMLQLLERLKAYRASIVPPSVPRAVYGKRTKNPAFLHRANTPGSISVPQPVVLRSDDGDNMGIVHMQTTRKKCVLALCQLLSTHNVPNVYKAAKVVEMYIFDKCSDNEDCYRELFEIFIKYLHDTLQMEVSFEVCCNIFIKNAPREIANWRLYGASLKSSFHVFFGDKKPDLLRKTRQERAPEAAEMGFQHVTLTETPPSVLDCESVRLLWNRPRRQVHSAMGHMLLNYHSSMQDLAKVATLFEYFIFIWMNGYRGDLRCYKTAACKFEKYMSSVLSKNKESVPLAVNAFGFKILETQPSNSLEIDTDRVAYARALSIQILINILEFFGASIFQSLQVTLELWIVGSHPSYDALISVFTGTMTRLLCGVSSGGSGLNVSDALQVAKTVEKSIDQFERGNYSNSSNQLVENAAMGVNVPDVSDNKDPIVVTTGIEPLSRNSTGGYNVPFVPTEKIDTKRSETNPTSPSKGLLQESSNNELRRCSENGVNECSDDQQVDVEFTPTVSENSAADNDNNAKANPTSPSDFDRSTTDDVGNVSLMQKHRADIAEAATLAISANTSLFSVCEKYAVQVGLYLFGMDLDFIARLCGRESEEVARYITNDLSPEIVDIALHSGSPPSWSPGDSLRALDVPQIDRWSTVVQPAIDACLRLEKTVELKLKATGDSKQLLSEFFASAKRCYKGNGCWSGKPPPDQIILYKEALRIIVAWYQKFYQKFVASYNAFVAKVLISVKKMRSVKFAIDNIYGGMATEALSAELKAAEAEVSYAISRVKEWINLRISVENPALLNFDVERDIHF